jgi:hypothetical protein
LPFFTELPKNPREFLLAFSVQQIRRRSLLPPIHAHVDGAFRSETKSTFRPIDLR